MAVLAASPRGGPATFSASAHVVHSEYALRRRLKCSPCSRTPSASVPKRRTSWQRAAELARARGSAVSLGRRARCTIGSPGPARAERRRRGTTLAVEAVAAVADAGHADAVLGPHAEDRAGRERGPRRVALVLAARAAPVACTGPMRLVADRARDAFHRRGARADRGAAFARPPPPANDCALHAGTVVARLSPAAWQLTHQCSPPAPVTVSAGLLVAARRRPTPCAGRRRRSGSASSRPTCSSTTLSSAPKSGLFTACAITERCHSATCRAWHGRTPRRSCARAAAGRRWRRASAVMGGGADALEEASRRRRPRGRSRSASGE